MKKKFCCIFKIKIKKLVKTNKHKNIFIVFSAFFNKSQIRIHSFQNKNRTKFFFFLQKIDEEEMKRRLEVPDMGAAKRQNTTDSSSTTTTSTSKSSNPSINPYNGQNYSKKYFDILEKRTKLPVWEQKEEFMGVYRANQVMILVGETGSGKTTQVII